MIRIPSSIGFSIPRCELGLETAVFQTSLVDVGSVKTPDKDATASRPRYDIKDCGYESAAAPVLGLVDLTCRPTFTDGLLSVLPGLMRQL